MINVTEQVLNFHKLLTAIANALSSIGLFKGSDQWDNLSEGAFQFLIVDYLRDNYFVSIGNQYEVWGSRADEDSLIVEAASGADILVGKEDESLAHNYVWTEMQDTESSVIFFFIEFGHPAFPSDDIDRLNYVMGVDENERLVCAKLGDCKFFVNS